MVFVFGFLVRNQNVVERRGRAGQRPALFAPYTVAAAAAEGGWATPAS